MSQKLKKLAAATLFALSSLSASQAHAVGRLADLSITDRGTGAVLPLYYHRGEYWVAGRPGAKYAITLCNRVGERLLGVTSVDGINVLSGDTAGWGQSGYVFAGRSCHSITGWRKSDSEVAAFEFSASSDSYAELTGRPKQVGVIGIAIFRERVPEPVLAPPAIFDRGDADRLGAAKESRADRAPGSTQGGAPAPAATALAEQKAAGEVRDTAQRSSAAAPMPVTPKLGTAHGQREDSYVSHTQFERAQNRPNEVISIRYDSREALVALGVIQEAPRRPSPTPNPFPQSANASYVPDPPAPRY